MMPPPALPTSLHDIRIEGMEKGIGTASALELEFEQLWETMSDLGNDDLNTMKASVVLSQSLHLH